MAGHRTFIIAIDGPAGAGKSTIAKRVADELGVVRVDTGALYRVIALVASERGVLDPDDIADMSQDLEIELSGDDVQVDGRDVTNAIRSEDVSNIASRISSSEAVRAQLLEMQRDLGRAHSKGAVVDGRDIGTVVFPDAEVKVFLTASTEERARRRHRDLVEAGDTTDYGSVLASIIERDRRDEQRLVAPMKAASDATVLDSTEMTPDAVVARIVQLVREKGWAD